MRTKNQVTIVTCRGVEAWPRMRKDAVAVRLVAGLAQLRRGAACVRGPCPRFPSDACRTARVFPCRPTRATERRGRSSPRSSRIPRSSQPSPAPGFSYRPVLPSNCPRGTRRQIRPRSGLASQNGVTVLNAPGTIDGDYRGEIGVLLVNLGGEPFEVVRGARIAQLVVAWVEHAILIEAASLNRRRVERAASIDRGASGREGMQLLSRRSMLAVAAVADIALHARPEPVAAKTLAAPPRSATPPSRDPASGAGSRRAFLKGVRGPRGGYELARERRRISAAEVIRAVMNGESEAKTESRFVENVISPIIAHAGEAFLSELELVSIDDICR